MIQTGRDIREAQLKIAFHMMGGDDWTAGYVYLKNLFDSLRQVYAGEVDLSLLVPGAEGSMGEYVKFLKADEVIPYRSYRRWTPLWAINGVIKRLLLRDMAMGNVLREHRVNTVFGPMLDIGYGGIGTMSWIPDFQHVHLPEMFSEAERFYRDKLFLRCAKVSTRIILTTEAAREDFQLFVPKLAHKARVLHPVSCIPQSLYNRNLNTIVKFYHLPEKFVYLPNQFWKHKNHETVFEAVKVLKNRGIKVFMVCTGNPVDYRHPTYFADLVRKMSEWNIRDQFAFLGLIPHEYVLLLMRQSICVLNPSFFEGWGYTVNEARSVGKQVLLSDIGAHREQDPPKATFFKPHDCEDLAEKLLTIWSETAPGPDFELESEAQQSLPQRLHDHAESFMSVAREVIRGRRGRDRE